MVSICLSPTGNRKMNDELKYETMPDNRLTID